MTDDTPVTVNRIERILITMIVSVVGLALLAIVLTLIGDAVLGFTLPDVVYVLPTIALPIGFLLILSLMIIALIRRRRASGDAS